MVKADSRRAAAARGRPLDRQAARRERVTTAPGQGAAKPRGVWRQRPEPACSASSLPSSTGLRCRRRRWRGRAAAARLRPASRQNRAAGNAIGPPSRQGRGAELGRGLVDRGLQRRLGPPHPARQQRQPLASSPSRASTGISVAQPRPGEARIAVGGIVGVGDCAALQAWRSAGPCGTPSSGRTSEDLAVARPATADTRAMRGEAADAAAAGSRNSTVSA